MQELKCTKEQIYRPILKWLKSSADTSLILSSAETYCEKVGVFAG